MNREIKFRAWDEESMFYSNNFEFSFRGNRCLMELPAPRGRCSVVAMQFTGLLDKNGKEIYEGDIVKIGRSRRQEVFFSEGAFMVKLYQTDKFINTPLCHFKLDDVEVTGNIYESSDLLV